MQTFCDAIFLRAGEATAYCERFPLDDKTAQAEQLLTASALADARGAPLNPHGSIASESPIREGPQSASFDRKPEGTEGRIPHYESAHRFSLR